MPGSTQLYVNFFAAIGQLCLVLIALRQRNRSVLAVPISLLFLSVFGFTTADLMDHVSHSRIWNALSHLLASLTLPFAFEFVVAFVGKRRRYARYRPLWWGPIALLALVPIGSGFSEVARRLDDRPDSGGRGFWAAAMLVIALPITVATLRELWLHFRHSSEPHERARARAILLATAIGMPLALTDLLNAFFPELPQLAAPSLLGICGVLLYAAMRERLLEDELPMGALALALLAAASGFASYVWLVRMAGAHPGLFVFGSFIVAVPLSLLTLQVARAASEGRRRQRQLTLLGRFSAQLGHDLKNPLAAMKGAGQFLIEETRRGPVSPEMVRESLGVMLAQVDRIHGAIDRYQRMSSVAPVTGPLEVNQLVRRVLSMQEFASGGRVEVRCELAPELPLCRADESLLGPALDNLVKNATEAIPDVGRVVVKSSVAAPAEPPGVVLTIEDNGVGIDVRQLERVFDEFYTTKAGGSGLGLSFVRRVVEAHGGAISISSDVGRGTTVRLRLPLA